MMVMMMIQEHPWGSLTKYYIYLITFVRHRKE